MYDFKIEAGTKAAFYDELAKALESLVAGEPDQVANMANAAALIMEQLGDLNWAGFYRNVEGTLVLGPFQGRAACIRIPFGKGVCGAAAESRETQRVEDVHAFPGHIACDAASRSELVVPIMKDGELFGVLDLDSPSPARFDAEDEAGCEKLVRALEAAL
ncbi:GAF domain-containing protein [Sphingomicrobium aestuariivivum]|uniref:GAF domain-containing protein n=1 Tax=Sphingomicrobium aestuariivivum TaxID=1582356 RepID=UPI001FD71733|nr:GAF domain-containing protein [Sphingomicrobium aestuariivivum]MCJ8190587.1 GAF domain-containing protein [Sphingomicrobium aestuariivivum]